MIPLIVLALLAIVVILVILKFRSTLGGPQSDHATPGEKLSPVAQEKDDLENGAGGMGDAGAERAKAGAGLERTSGSSPTAGVSSTRISTIPNLARLVPMQGVAYTPVPSDGTPVPPLKYFDTDFTNSTFPLLWGSTDGGRGDIREFGTIGVNFVHLYDWSVPPAPGSAPGDYQRNHLPFLQACAAVGVNVFVPISNYFMEQIHQGANVSEQIRAMVAEVYNGGTTPVPGAGMWGIANEFDLATKFNIDNVVQAMVYLVQAEQSMGIPTASLLPVTSPVSFAATGSLPPAIAAIRELQRAIQANAILGTDFWNGRFVASANSFNEGDYLRQYITGTFPQYFPDLPFFLSEMGIDISGDGPVKTEEDQAAYVFDQLKNTVPSGNFLGRCVFQFLNQTAMKTGTEATFGMTKYAGSTITTGTIPAGYTPGGGETYPVDALTQKPLYQSVVQVYRRRTR